jgi:Ni/Co efflux regulator RcnB
MRFLIAFSLLFLTTSAAFAQQPSDMVLEAGKRIFTEVERQIIRDVLERAGIPAEDTVTKNDDDEDEEKYSSNKGKEKNKDKHKDKGKNKGLPPGLAKKSQLPYGLAKKDTLPPGLQKRDLPMELNHQLPPPPPGTERVIVDNSVLLIETGTNIILDIIQDVITKN